MTRFVRTLWLCLAVAFSASLIGHAWTEAAHEAEHASHADQVSVAEHLGEADGQPHEHLVQVDIEPNESGGGDGAIGHHHHGADGHTGLPAIFAAMSDRAGEKGMAAWAEDDLPPTLRGDGPDMPPRSTRI